MKRLKKFTGLITAMIIFMNLILPCMSVHADSKVRVGDYISFGKYYDEPILWKVINIDEDGDPLLFSEEIISIKAFDSPGKKHTNNNAERAMNGSNLWRDSNIRQWLNSNEEKISWIQNPPSLENLYFSYTGTTYNPYDAEKGFLADGNFTEIERVAIKPVTHKSLLAEEDSNLKDGGTEEFFFKDHDSYKSLFPIKSYDAEAYDKTYYHNVTDNVFLLDIKELHDYVWRGKYDITAYPTAKAVENSLDKSDELSANKTFRYWIRSPKPRGSSETCLVYGSNYGTEHIGYAEAKSILVLGTFGIRPALYLNMDSLGLKSGTGSIGQPYTIDYSLKQIEVAASKVIAKQNSYIEVPVNVSNAKKLCGIEFAVNYDPSVAICEEVIKGSFANSFDITPNYNEVSKGIVRVSLPGKEALNGSGEICRFRFKVKGNKGTKTQLTISDLRLNDKNGLELDSFSENGEISVASVIKYGDANVDNSINTGDSTVIGRHAVGLEKIQGQGLLAADVDDNGNVTNYDSILVSKYAAKLITQFPAETQTNKIARQAQGVLNNSTVEIKSIKAQKGSTATVNISLKDVSDFIGGQFEINYDPEIVVCTGIEKTAWIQNFSLLSNLNDAENGRVKFIFSKLEDGLNGSGDIIRLNFNIKGKEGQYSKLSINQALLSSSVGEEAAAKTLDGEIIVGNKQETFESWGKTIPSTVSKDKEWKITFSEAVAQASIENSVYIYDLIKKERFPITVDLQNEGKTLLIKHTTDFQSEGRYVLYIEKSIRGIEGSKILKKAIKMPFTVE